MSFDKFGHLEEMRGDYLDRPTLSGCPIKSRCQSTCLRLPGLKWAPKLSIVTAAAQFVTLDHFHRTAHKLFKSSLSRTRLGFHISDGDRNDNDLAGDDGGMCLHYCGSVRLGNWHAYK